MTKLSKIHVLKTIFVCSCKKKIIFNAKMKIDVAMKNHSNNQTLFKIKLKDEFKIMIIIIKLNIQNQIFFFTTM